tara:strand:- start:4000 stop:5406 length:1407 start_codon:yes stop_codon:yes gene_type:complete
MANGFSDLLGRIARPFYPGRDLDEEERRRIEELRAQGVYVPQERRITPFGYGSGRQRRENLTAIRAAIQPAQERALNEYLWRQNEAARMDAAKEARKVSRKRAASEQRSAIKRESSPRAVADRKRKFEEELKRNAERQRRGRALEEELWRAGASRRGDAAKEVRGVQRKSAISGQRTADKVSAMGEAGRDRREVETFNREQARRKKLREERDRVGTGRVAEINALEAKQRHAIEGTGDPDDPWVRADKDRLDYLKQQQLPTSIQQETFKQQQQATAVGERVAPTHAAQQQQAQATARLGEAVAKQELDVVEALNNSRVNGQAYTTILAELKSGSAELENRLNQIKLDVQNSQYGKELMAKVASGQLQKADALLEQELMSITAFKQWLMSPDGLNFQSRGGTLGVDIDLKLAQIEALLERAKAETARARSYGGGVDSNLGALTNPGKSGYVAPAPWDIQGNYNQLFPQE